MIAYTDYRFDARVRREAETLAAAGFNVLCLTTKNGAERRRFEMNGVSVRELAVAKYRGKSAPAYFASYMWFLAAASAACLGLLVRRELDVVHAHNLPDFLTFAGLVPRLAGRKVVLDVHDSVPETFATKFESHGVVRRALCLEESLSARVAHRVICVNDPQRATLVRRGIPSSKTFVSMNVPDPAIFSLKESGPPKANRGTDFNLIYHGTMAHRLGVDLLIRAVAQLRERTPDIHLHLWGRGDDLPIFVRLAAELGIGDRVHFNSKGFDLRELPEHLRPMDLGVLGNRRNQATDLMLPVKLMEYVSLGIPAIAPKLPTIAHYFSDDMITFYEPENVASLADAIERLSRSPDARLAQAERALGFLDRFGWQRQGPELVAFYRELLQH
jgi:glycosyltransferase involved in cell wall biosynthesis